MSFNSSSPSPHTSTPVFGRSNGSAAGIRLELTQQQTKLSQIEWDMKKRLGDLEDEVGRLRKALDERFGGITTEKLLEIVARFDEGEGAAVSDGSDEDGIESEAEETLSKRLTNHPKIKVMPSHPYT